MTGENLTKKYPVTALILAGGKSSRFGRDKALLEYDNRKIVERLAAECEKVCSEVLVVSGSGQKFAFESENIREIADFYKGAGPMGGLQAGLAAAANEICLLMACDMPFLKADLMRLFIEQTAEYQIVLPKNGEDIEPMFGIYRKNLLPAVEEFLTEGRRSLLNLTKRAETLCLPQAVWGQVTAGKDVFFNINYQNDYQKLLAGEADHSRQTDRKAFYREFLDKK